LLTEFDGINSVKLWNICSIMYFDQTKYFTAFRESQKTSVYLFLCSQAIQMIHTQHYHQSVMTESVLLYSLGLI